MQHLWITQASKCSKNLQTQDACCHHRELGVQEAALGCWWEEKHHCEAFVEFNHTLACHWHQPSSRFGGLFRGRGPIVPCLKKNSLQGLACPHQVSSSAIYKWRDWVHLGLHLFLSKSNTDPGRSSFSANLFSCQHLSRVEIKLIVLIELHLLQAGLPAGAGVTPHCCPASRHRRLSTSQNPLRVLMVWSSLGTVMCT